LDDDGADTVGDQARMERSEIRDSAWHLAQKTPDCAAPHPGDGLNATF